MNNYYNCNLIFQIFNFYRDVVLISAEAIETLGRTVFLPEMWYLISAWSRTFFIGLAGLTGLIWLVKQNLTYWRLPAALGLGLGIVVPINYLLRRIFASPRPFEVGNFEPLEHFQPLLQRDVTYGFPSNHAAATAVFAICFILVGYKKTGALVTLLTLLVGASRVIVGLHFIGDIIGGWVVGITCGYLGYRLEKPVTALLAHTGRKTGLIDIEI